jgi:hypothetical protein
MCFKSNCGTLHTEQSICLQLKKEDWKNYASNKTKNTVPRYSLIYLVIFAFHDFIILILGVPCRWLKEWNPQYWSFMAWASRHTSIGISRTLVQQKSSCTYSAPLLGCYWPCSVEIGPIPMRAAASTGGSKPHLNCHRSTQYIVHLCRRHHFFFFFYTKYI